ncbi:hypothetical protein QJS10_CPA10g01999 [Acorus calamus]|uniref:Mitochondrial import inner membrane translocase subunit TIM50 n=1 Tax=Acorus calamus TaxID=4465 RepID=A0AAV9DYD0_ACOCL|nr:hypothetical protein QJS10_CPA10g01999 [Acorus calamus]
MNRSSMNVCERDAPQLESESAKVTYERKRRDGSTPSTSEVEEVSNLLHRAEDNVENDAGVIFSSNNSLDDSEKTCTDTLERNGELLLDNVQLHGHDLPPKEGKGTRSKKARILASDEVHGDTSLTNIEESWVEVPKAKDEEYDDLQTVMPISKKEPVVPVNASDKESISCSPLSGGKDYFSGVPEVKEKIMSQPGSLGNNTKNEDNVSPGRAVDQKNSSDLKPIRSEASVSHTGKDTYIPQVSEWWTNSLWGPERSISRTRKILLVLDLNGLLADVFFDIDNAYRGDKMIGGKTVFKRPFCDEFLKFCFERFSVGIWSSRRRNNVDGLVDFLMGDMKYNLLFCWDQSMCTMSKFNTLENKDKPMVFKDLKKLWNKKVPGLPWERGDYSRSNTLLVDDSPYKALCNPSGCGIFPHPYNFMDSKDNSLGPGGELHVYLEALSNAAHVPSYVKTHPFGQRPITQSHPSWKFYIPILRSLGFLY